jgi:hypothetical protein
MRYPRSVENYVLEVWDSDRGARIGLVVVLGARILVVVL